MNELIYKISLGLLVIAMNGIRFYFQQRYKTTHAHRIPEREPIRERVLVGIVTLSLAPPGLLWLFTDWLSFGQLSLPDGVRVVGFLIGAYAMWLFYRVHRQLGDNWSLCWKSDLSINS
ncbi:hypothetical protein GO755_28210 [Spirosoma sp. HMF4905]|uniref:Uncharacterized protein n=1 Tax=Spirosoma arboris TaxID=2682092 RepID=A0A7K1SJI0_9BACT|nr:hypothetical protein [Spirosoma arboris]MVM33952.1 hypothetical protein [Spirosoma arboris]